MPSNSKVNEEGSEAAAASAVVVMTFGGSLPRSWKADQPFVYSIWTGQKLLFAGKFAPAS
jgi:serine protease inhibitor